MPYIALENNENGDDTVFSINIFNKTNYLNHQNSQWIFKYIILWQVKLRHILESPIKTMPNIENISPYWVFPEVKINTT